MARPICEPRCGPFGAISTLLGGMGCHAFAVVFLMPVEIVLHGLQMPATPTVVLGEHSPCAVHGEQRARCLPLTTLAAMAGRARRGREYGAVKRRRGPGAQ